MRLHLVDATYELFRAHFAPRPPVLGRDGIPLSGVSGLVEQLLYLLREEGATHVGAATDRVIDQWLHGNKPPESGACRCGTALQGCYDDAPA